MKTIATVRKLTGALLAGVALMLFGTAANAANTAANTTISNSATVNYSVNSVPQTAITSTAATFKVDQAILITVAKADVSRVGVTPGQTAAAVLAYTVENDGNANEDVKLTSIAETSGTADPFGGVTTDSFDASGTITFYADTNTNGVYDAGTDTAITAVANLAPGVANKKTVFLVITGGAPIIAANLLDGAISVYALQGQAAVAGTCATTCTIETQDTATDKNANTTNLNTVYKIFDDTVAGSDDLVKDGKGSARDTFIVKSAQLTISKASVILSDPLGDAKPRAIPGSVVKYTITVSNSSTATLSATGVAVTDALTSQIGVTTSWNTSSLTVTSPSGTIATCADDGINTTTASGVTCDYNKTAATTVTVSGITLAANQSATVSYTVTIL